MLLYIDKMRCLWYSVLVFIVIPMNAPSPEESVEMPLYGFFLRGAFDRFGGDRYQTPSGEEVIVSYVSNNPDYSNPFLPKLEKMGVVTKFVCRVEAPPHSPWKFWL